MQEQPAVGVELLPKNNPLDPAVWYPFMMSTCTIFCALLVIVTSDPSAIANPRMKVTPEMLAAPRVYPATDLTADGVEAIYYEGMPWKGKPTRVFAWIGFPEMESADTKVPGMVLVHGGGGTAFADWVKLWTSRGYAAIAMDTCGNIPRGTYGNWQRQEWGGPSHGHLDQVDLPLEDQWPYHAVADVLLAHSLLRSKPQVDPARIGLTGISWGGYLTCIVSGLDDRFQFAVPVYGCGHLGSESLLSTAIANQPERGAKWLSLWDPCHFLADGEMPKLWVTGTNDRPFPLPALQQSYRDAGGEQTLCIRLRMPHGHGAAGEGPKEIHSFADARLKGQTPLPTLTSSERRRDRVTATFASVAPIAKAELLFTADKGLWSEREWNAIPADLDSSAQRVTATIPSGATVYYLNIEDDRGNVVSTEHEELTGP